MKYFSSMITLLSIATALTSSVSAASIRGAQKEVQTSSKQEQTRQLKMSNNKGTSAPYVPQTLSPMAPITPTVNNNNNNEVEDRDGDVPVVKPVPLRDIAVVVNYVDEPETISWQLQDLNTERYILGSTFGQVTEPGIVVTFKDQIPAGSYMFIMNNMKGTGLSQGAGWVKIMDVTGIAESARHSLEFILDFGTVVFSHNGRFGPMLMEEFKLN